MKLGDLRQVARAHARGVGDGALVRLQLAHQQLEQRRLAGAVRAYQPDTVVGLNAEGDAGKDQVGAVVFGEVGDDGE